MDASLSGGEAKRIEIATVLARGAKLSIFDEPEAGIDLWSFSKLVETFQELQKSHQGTLLIISHQERILSIADEIVVIADGYVRGAGPREEILPTLLADWALRSEEDVKGLVAVVPCTGFGAPHYVRWSFAVSMENIKEGMDRLEKFLKNA